jgi:hypothetical protein
VGRDGGRHKRTERLCANNCGTTVLAGNSRKRCDACRAVFAQESQKKYSKKRWATPRLKVAVQKRNRERSEKYSTATGNRQTVIKDRQGRLGFSAQFLESERIWQGSRCRLWRVSSCFGDLVIDHDHETGTFRGWLCRQHNAALGKLGDQVETLLQVVSYLGERRATGS